MVVIFVILDFFGSVGMVVGFIVVLVVWINVFFGVIWDRFF